MSGRAYKHVGQRSSEQRSGWFARGYDSGRMADCDTFGAERL
ncbi:neutral zinc metallopeptidase [Primorskyibacter marinus]|nr:neutral zinc metallopeptidase [Primorskyibacter marinus]